MPDACPHCKRSAAALDGVLTERLAGDSGDAITSDALKALVVIKLASRPRRAPYATAFPARSWDKTAAGGLKPAH
jgi:hypothetical protein